MNTIHNTVEVKTQEAKVGSLWTSNSGKLFMLCQIAPPHENYKYVAIDLADGHRWSDAVESCEDAVYSLTFLSDSATITVS